MIGFKANLVDDVFTASSCYRFFLSSLGRCNCISVYFVCIALRDFSGKRFISNVFIIIIIIISHSLPHHAGEWKATPLGVIILISDHL